MLSEESLPVNVILELEKREILEAKRNLEKKYGGPFGTSTEGLSEKTSEELAKRFLSLADKTQEHDCFFSEKATDDFVRVEKMDAAAERYVPFFALCDLKKVEIKITDKILKWCLFTAQKRMKCREKTHRITKKKGESQASES